MSKTQKKNGFTVSPQNHLPFFVCVLFIVHFELIKLKDVFDAGVI